MSFSFLGFNSIRDKKDELAGGENLVQTKGMKPAAPKTGLASQSVSDYGSGGEFLALHAEPTQETKKDKTLPKAAPHSAHVN
jgi:hypothetical protein